MRLASLTHDSDPDASAENLRRAVMIYRQLAKAKADDARYQIDWLEAEMTSALRAGAKAGAPHLTRVQEINRTLSGKWPTDPDALYRLACYLTGSEAILAPAGEESTGKAGPTPMPATGDSNR
jgi:hypothetical protein